LALLREEQLAAPVLVGVARGLVDRAPLARALPVGLAGCAAVVGRHLFGCAADQLRPAVAGEVNRARPEQAAPLLDRAIGGTRFLTIFVTTRKIALPGNRRDAGQGCFGLAHGPQPELGRASCRATARR